jgi:hypothetical protein
MSQIIFQTKRIINGLRYRILGESHVTAYYRFKQRLATRDMLFVPAVPHHPGYLMTKICAELRLRPTSSAANATVGMLFWDRTQNEGSDRPILNAKCTDISKRRMEEAFQKVFGYSLAIDPLIYTGKAVCKSDENAAHDGYVIQCPIQEKVAGRVYEVLIDNSIADDVVEDIRVSVVGNRLPLAYLKRRWKHQRFVNTNFEVKISAVESVTSAAERDLILKFAGEIGLDFGELDTLRDRTTGKLYIVDAAKTPFGPPGRLSFLNKRRAVKMISRAFMAEFIDCKP